MAIPHAAHTAQDDRRLHSDAVQEGAIGPSTGWFLWFLKKYPTKGHCTQKKLPRDNILVASLSHRRPDGITDLRQSGGHCEYLRLQERRCMHTSFMIQQENENLC